MPQFTIRKCDVDTLNRYGVYDEWVANVKKLWDDELEHRLKVLAGYPLDGEHYPARIIIGTFKWEDSNEGSDFWVRLYDRVCEDVLR
jgi:hypothetical protein